jgi:hypothetical protein
VRMVRALHPQRREWSMVGHALVRACDVGYTRAREVSALGSVVAGTRALLTSRQFSAARACTPSSVHAVLLARRPLCTPSALHTIRLVRRPVCTPSDPVLCAVWSCLRVFLSARAANPLPNQVPATYILSARFSRCTEDPRRLTHRRLAGDRRVLRRRSWTSCSTASLVRAWESTNASVAGKRRRD